MRTVRLPFFSFSFLSSFSVNNINSFTSMDSNKTKPEANNELLTFFIRLKVGDYRPTLELSYLSYITMFNFFAEHSENQTFS